METGALGRREAHKRGRIKEAAISRRQNLQEWQRFQTFPDRNQASYHKALRPQLTAMPDIQAYFP